MNSPLAIVNGIFHFENQPTFLVSGDYPYYRDDPENWQDRLEKMKQGAFRIVTFYIPWRHHFVKFDENHAQICDFAGETSPNKNVIEFINLAFKIGLWVCIKPGPFIHAETNYGGLPDFVNPEHNSQITPFQNFLALEGKKQEAINRWPFLRGKSLPSPLDPEFLRLTREYFYLIAKEVVNNRIYPQGPIILMQFLNEGLYSEGRAPLSISGNYSFHNISRFRHFLTQKYNSLEHYNLIHHSFFHSFEEIFPPTTYSDQFQYQSIQQFQKFIDWDDFGISYYAEWINQLKTSMMDALDPDQKKLFPPLIANWNPPGDFGQGLDVWITRVNPERILLNVKCHMVLLIG